jgi:hypothetical protein
VDESGRSILGMLQKAADMAKEDSARAMDIAYKLSLQLRAVEERAKAGTNHHRRRRVRAIRSAAERCTWGHRMIGVSLSQLHFDGRPRGRVGGQRG